MEVLAAELADLMREDPLAPFESERIVVPHPTIGRWLSLELARALGIAANLRFEQPAEFAWSIMRGVAPELPREQPYAPAQLRWRIHDLLPRFIEEADGRALRGYLRDGDPRKRFELADRLARVFDRCLLYRPDWIRRWTLEPPPHWQARLWRLLIETEGPRGGAHWVAAIDAFRAALATGRPAHDGPLAEPRIAAEGAKDRLEEARAGGPSSHARRAGGAEDARNEARAGGPPRGDGVAGRAAEAAPVLWRPPAWPRRASFFAVPALSPSYLEMLCEATRGIELHLFLLNPCREYWGDVHSRREIARRARGADPRTRYFSEGNELLAAWGRAGRDTFDTLIEVAGVESEEHFVVPAGAHRLAALQRDILDLRLASEAAEEPAAGAAAADDSLQIHVCHSPLREAEVLHDRLLALFDLHPDLEPAGVLVLTPALEIYGPAIEAVFGAAGRIPCHVARAREAESRALRAFLDLLALSGSRYGAESVLAPLAAPALRARFGIDEGDLPALRDLVREAGIRWGVDEAHREGERLPATSEHTWWQGLRRLLLGYAMADADTLIAGLVPCPPLGSAGFATGDTDVDAEALGRFLTYCEAACALRERLAGERRPAEWAEALREVAGAFFADPPPSREWSGAGSAREGADETRVLRELVRDFAREAAGGESPVRLEVVRDVLRERADESARAPLRLADGVCVASLAPGRIFPAEVVCVAGMNHGVFPRSPSSPSFDLVAAGSARRGDRDVRHEDRFAFLEALLAARRAFVVSYTGRGLRDDAAIPPSVLVDEVRDYLDRRFPGAAFETRHPLQPFSPRYFAAPDAPQGPAAPVERRAGGTEAGASEGAGSAARASPDEAASDAPEAGSDAAKEGARGAAGAAAPGRAGGVASGAASVTPRPGPEGEEDHKGVVATLGTATGRAGGASGAATGGASGSAGLFSYSRGMCEAARAMRGGREAGGTPDRFAAALPEPDESRRRVTLAELIAFFANPARAFLRDRLGARLEVDDLAVDEEEPFEIEGLERYRLRSQTWGQVQAGTAAERGAALLRGSGRLPHANLGRVVHERAREEAKQLEDRLAPYRAVREAPPREFDVELGGFRIGGTIDHLGPDPGTSGADASDAEDAGESGPDLMLWWRIGRLRARDRIEIGLRQLAWAAAGARPPRAVGFSLEQGTWKSTTFPPPARAGEQLESWLRARWSGLTAPLPFFPETSLAYAQVVARFGDESSEAALAKARGVWCGDRYRRGERSDAYLDLVHGDHDPLGADFEDLARELLVPLLGAGR